MPEPRQFSLQDRFKNPVLEQGFLAAMAANPQIYFQTAENLPLLDFGEHGGLFIEMGTALESSTPLPSLPESWRPLSSEQEINAAAIELGNLSKKRSMAKLAESMLVDLNKPDLKPEEALNRYEEEIAKTRQKIRETSHSQVISVADRFDDILRDVQKRYVERQENGRGYSGISTGLKRLDELLGGLQEGVHVLAAEPGCGKTTFARQIGAKVASSGVPCLFVSFEESVDRLVLKLVCSEAGLVAKKFLDGFGNPKELELAYRESYARLAPLYFVEGGASSTVNLIKAKAHQVMARHGVNRCLIIVDYLQQWAGKRRDFQDFRHTVGSLLGDLRELSLRIKSPLLVISSQNRAGQGAGTMTSLKESGDLEYGSDSIMFLVNSSERGVAAPARSLDLVIAKNRYGDKGTIKMIFKPDVGVFREESQDGFH